MALVRAEVIKPASLDRDNRFRVGAALSPRYISEVISSADDGDTEYLHDLLNEIKQKDPVIHSLLETREQGLLSCGYTVTAAKKPGAKKATARAERVAEFVRRSLEQCQGFHNALAHLLDGIYKGFSVAEIDWKKVNGSIVPARIRPIAGRRFRFTIGQTLVFYDNGFEAYPGRDVFAEYPYKFLVHQPRVNGDDPVREGVGRTALWYACFRNWSWRDWMQFAELYGRPWRIIKYKKESADSEDREVALEVANNANASTSQVISDALDIEIKWPEATGSGQGTPAEAIISRATDELALLILGQLGTTGDVQNGLGGKGDAREKVRGDKIEADGRALAETLTNQLIKWMVAFEFGEQEPLPKFQFTTEESIDTKSFLEGLKIATVDVGLPVPADYVREQLGWPKGSPNEEMLGVYPEDKPETEAVPIEQETPEAG